MPVSVTYPGVYIREVSSGVRTITGVATSIAAFVGYTRKGLPDKAVTITSFADFERLYGGLDRDSPLSYGVRQFFTNGGTQAIIVRVATAYASASWTLNNAAAAPVLQVKAATPGSWANSLRLSVEYTISPPSVRNPYAEFNLIVSQYQGTIKLPIPLETHRNLTMDGNSSQYVESVVNNASTLIRVSREPLLVFANSGYAVSGPITFPLSTTNPTIGGTINGNTPFLLSLEGAPWADAAALVTATNSAITGAGLSGSLKNLN